MVCGLPVTGDDEAHPGAVSQGELTALHVVEMEQANAHSVTPVAER